ncbi:MAG: 1,4-alpha-glucan branching protein GlgB, partial [Clostridiaceae bacterium]
MENGKPTDFDIHCFHEGTNYKSYEFLGCHLVNDSKLHGASFSIWAPNAYRVSVVGNFNNWNGENHFMIKIKDSGIWNIFIPEVKEGDNYKYEIYSSDNKNGENPILKADPFAYYSEKRPDSASIVYDYNGYEWNDKHFIEKRENSDIYTNAINIYEVHLGSWKNHEDGENRFYNYRELAEELPDYVKNMGYTHIEVLPIMEHPLDDSWGYQTTGYFSVTSRYGKPKDFMYFVDKCHEKGIGVILDWAPSHFCKDSHGLYNFDGTHLYENSDPLIGENPDWGTANFDFERLEVQSFLISNAIFWFLIYHVDGFRVDAVANMLYLTYGKKESLNLKNKYGGTEKLESVDFLKKLNEAIFNYVKNPLVIAEDSSTWPNLTSPTYIGGIGFNYKWNMGWMNDMLKYMESDPIHRKWNHDKLTFSLFYAFTENFVLPFSHDEVVHGKKSLLNKMPGDYWNKFANLRLLYGYMIAHPGKKLLFMGGEFGQFIEWNFKQGLDWVLLLYPQHKMMHDYVKELNFFYKDEKALWEKDLSYEGFEWIDHSNFENSIISFIRKGNKKQDYLIFICNFTPKVYYDYKIGVPEKGFFEEIFNSDNIKYGGSGQLNSRRIKVSEENWNNQKYSVTIKIPPLAMICLGRLSNKRRIRIA